MNTGPKLKNDGLVFGYDTGYDANGESLSRHRHYKGPSYFNILETHSNSQSSTTTNFSFVYGEEEVKIPKIGKVVSKYCDYNNNRYAADGSVNSGTSCCPNLFYYHSGHIDAETDTNYTYSIVYKHSLNYTHPNFMYRYEYNSSGVYIKEGGLHSTSDTRRTHLGNGWYHAWGSFTTTSTTARIYAYSFLYNYGLQTDRFYVAKIALVKNQTGQTHFIIPPHQLLAPGSSAISSTGSLIDLKKTRDIDVSSVSFDSDGQPELDGTNDDIDLGSDVTFKPNGGDWTVESIVKYDVVPDSYNNSTAPGNFIGADGISFNSWYWSVLSKKLALWNISPGVWKYGSTTLVADKFYHAVLVCEPGGTTYKMYLNGVEEGGTHSGFAFNASYSGLKVRYFGRGNVGNTRLVNGKIPVTKIYETALTATEIKSNFNAYKNRFDL
tara:strand:+ start:838 stop:2148 length:1311 start_codon:yes stop_codon:yes gene_type:complete